MTKIIFAVICLSAFNVFAAGDCSTLEKAKQELANYANSGASPYDFGTANSNYKASDFDGLEENPGLCYFISNYDDCASVDSADYGMNWSFEPGRKGWVAISKTCEVETDSYIAD